MQSKGKMHYYDGVVETIDIKRTPGAGLLSGLTFAVKDMIDIEGRVSGFGNPDWKATHAPAAANAPVLEKLLDAGARLIAVACADELACSLDGINVHFGTPINSQAPDRIPGGSSSGSASLAAAGRVDFAIGTDTAGSVRVPAAYCGIFGLRPTHDAIPLQGVLQLGPSFDTVGILSGSIDILARVANVLLADETTSLPRNLVLPANFAAPIDDEIAPYLVAHVESIKAHFDSVRSANLYQKSEQVYELFRIVRAHEAWSIHGGWFESIHPNMAPEIAKRLEGCKHITEGEYKSALKSRAELLKRIDEIVDCDSVICIPTTWALPPLKSASEAQLLENRNRNLCMTALSSFYGFPQITIPVPTASVKTGLSLIGARGLDLALLELAKQVQVELQLSAQ